MKFILPIFLMGCSVVSPGEKGIRITFGEANRNILEAGFYFSLPPISYLKHIDLQVQKSLITTSSASRDMQEINTELAINWQLEVAKVVETFINVGDEAVVYQKILLPAVSEVVKSEMAHLTAEEILTKRTQLKSAIDATLARRLSTYGIVPLDVSIINLTFSRDFTHAIEEKQIAEQHAKKAEYLAIQAEKEAVASVNKAKGEAESQRLMEKTLTPAILQKLALEKWDGKLPQYMLAGGSMPFIKLGEKKHDETL